MAAFFLRFVELCRTYCGAHFNDAMFDDVKTAHSI
jgi:hypothetical protein